MGFWDNVKAVGDGISKASKTVEKAAERHYEKMTDEQLAEALIRNSDNKKI